MGGWKKVNQSKKNEAYNWIKLKNKFESQIFITKSNYVPSDVISIFTHLVRCESKSMSFMISIIYVNLNYRLSLQKMKLNQSITNNGIIYDVHYYYWWSLKETSYEFLSIVLCIIHDTICQVTILEVEGHTYFSCGCVVFQEPFLSGMQRK